MKLAGFVLTMLLVAACAVDVGDSDEGDSPPSTRDPTSDTTMSSRPTDRTVTPTTSPSPFEPSIGSVPEEKLAPLETDAAQRASVDVESVEVIRAQQVVWSSPAFDCPEPGVAYTQVLTNGYWVVLAAGGDEYDYRAAIEGEFRLCVGGAPPHDVLVDR